MKNFIFTFLLVVNIYSILAIDSKRECSSRNDPHLIDFSNFNFEFHYLGQYCLYNSSALEVKAEFTECSPNSAVTCNCMLRIQLPTNEFVEINTCSGNPVYSTDLNQALDCSQVIPFTTSYFDVNFWNSFTSNHNRFKCATTSFNTLAIKTTLANGADDIIVLVDQFWPHLIDQIRVYPSDNYINNQGLAKDKCLCGNYSYNLEILDKEKCKKALIDECLMFLIRSLSEKETVLIEKLINECVLDKREMDRNRKGTAGLEVGFFQKNIFESSIIEILIKKYPGIRNQKGLQLILNRFCSCRRKKLNAECLFKMCKPPIQICV